MMRRLLLVAAFIAAAALGVARAQMIIQDGQPFVPKASGGGGSVTWTLESSVSQAGSASSGSTAISAFNGTGANLLVVFVSDYDVNTIGSVATTTPSNTLTEGPTVNAQSGDGRCTLFYILNPSVGSSMTITYTAGSGSDAYAGISAEAWKSSGGAGSGSYDQNNSGNNSSSNSVAAGSITPSIVNELITSAAGGFDADNTPDTPSVNSGTISQSFLSTVNTYGLAEAHYTDPADSAFNSTFSWVGTATYACAVVASFEPHS
jgi:hypothetical protein